MPVVVLLHAFPLDGRMWSSQVEALADIATVIAPDLRGFGSAAGDAHGLDEIPITMAADDVARLLDKRGVRQAIVGGISRGAYIAMAFARQYPDRLKALMLFDSRATPADETEQRNWTQMAERLTTAGIGFLPAAMQPRLLSPAAIASQPDLAARVRDIILSQDATAVAAAARGMATRPDARPGLASIRVPVLTVAGEEDAAFGSTKAIADAIPGAAFLALPATGHLTNLEQPAAVTAAIRNFLKAL